VQFEQILQITVH